MNDKDLIKEIKDILSSKSNEEDAQTTDDLKSITGFGDRKVRSALKELKKRGLLETVLVYREDLDGNLSQRPAYRLRHSSKISTG